MKITKAIIVILFFMVVAACNTVQGVGKDVQAIGGVIEKVGTVNE